MCRIVHNIFLQILRMFLWPKCQKKLDVPNVNEAWITKNMVVVQMDIGTCDILKCRFQKQKQNIISFL